MATKTFLPDRDYTSRFILGGATGGSGGDAHLPVGKSPDGFTYRTWLRFIYDWTGVGKITKAELHLRVANTVHGAPGADPFTVIRSLNGPIPSEPSSGENVWTDPYLNLPILATPLTSFHSPRPDGSDILVDITDLIEALAPNTVQKRDGSPGGGRINYGFALQGNTEGSSSVFQVFRSRNSANPAASRPYIVLTYEGPNVAPNAPGGLVPSGSIQRVANFTGTFSDPNTGDTLKATHIKVYDEGGGTLLWDQTYVASSAEVGASAFSVPIPALIRSGVVYEWEVRTQDQKGTWSAWSPRTSFRFLNEVPVVSALMPSGVSLASLSHVHFRATYNDPDGDPMGSYRIQLRVSTTPAHPDWDSQTHKWDSGDVPPTAPEVSGNQIDALYRGVGLTAGDYSWRVRASDKWGEFSAWVYGTLTLTQNWSPDPGDINFLTGYGEAPPRPRIVIRGMGTGRGPAATAPLAIIEDAANIGMSKYHNAAGEVYWTMPANHPQVSVIEPYQTHASVEEWRGDRFVEVWAGVVTDFDATEDDVVFYGTDYEGMVDKLVDSRYDPAAPDKPHTQGGSKYVDQTLTAIITDQLTMAKAKSNSPVSFIDISTLDVFAEKATIWSTFTPVLSFIVGLMQSHQQGSGKKSRFWVRKKAAGGYEFLLKDDPGVVRDNLRLEYGGIVQSFRLTAFGEFASFAHGIGKARDGANLYYTSEQATGIDPSIWGRIETTRLWDDVTDKNDLQRRLKQQAAAAARIGKRVALALRVDALRPFDGWDITDHIPVHIKRGVVDTTAYGSGYWTILGVEWFVFPDGHTELTLVILPREDDVAPDPDLIPSVPILPGQEWEIGYEPPVQGVNVGKLYLDLTTGKTYVLNPDGTYTETTTPPLPDTPTGLSLTTTLTYDATGDPIIKLTATVVQPTGTNNRGTWVEVTAVNDGAEPPQPIWDDTAVLLFIPAGENQVSFEGVAGNTLYFARCWSVDFVGVPSTKSASETEVTIKDEIAPNVPADFTVVGSVKAVLGSWTATTAADLAFYEFRYAVDDGSGTGVGGSPAWVIQRARTSFIYVGQLQEDTRYWAQVRAVDRSGNIDDDGVTRNYLDFPEDGWSELLSADVTLVNGALIEAGSIEPTHIAFLTAELIVAGILRINTSQGGMFDGIRIFADDGVTEIGRWDDTGLYVRSSTDSTDYVHINEASVTVYLNGAPVTAITPAGINASAITHGTMPQVENLVRNSSFESAAFSTATIVNTEWTADADWDATRDGTDTNITENAGDRQQGAATF